jgi:hypothetical protein
LNASTPGFEQLVLEAGAERLPCVRRGPDGGARLLIVQPLFEELNRTRRLLAETGAALAELGVASWLPDWPATGDHAEPDFSLARARAAVAAAAGAIGADGVLAVRGGALLVPEAVPALLFAPAEGAAILRDLLRARVAADAESGAGSTMAQLEARFAAGETLELAGYPVTPALAEELRAAGVEREGARVVALNADGGDVRLDGPPVWRQSEPEAAGALAAALAREVVAWLGR